MQQLRKAILAAAISTIFAAPVRAVEGPAAFTPSLTGATYPGTATPASAWKLVGQGNPTAVQIAPRWVLTVQHAAPPLGTVFTNAYGSSTVDASYLETAERAATGRPNSGDLALLHLSTPIPVPAAELPALLTDFLNADNSNLPGYMLAAGRGGNGPVRAHWLPASDNPSSGKVTASGAVAVDKDSGGGVFWYPAATARPILRNLLTFAGNPIGPDETQVGTRPDATWVDAHAWLTKSLAKHGADAGPLWASATATAPASARVPHMPEAPILLQTTASSAWINWGAPKPAAAGTPAPSSYIVRVSPGNLQYPQSATASSANLTGLTANTTYTASIEAVNSNGRSGSSWIKAVAENNVGSGTDSFTTHTPPNAFSNLGYELFSKTTVGLNVVGCVRFTPTYASTGPAATAFGITNYAQGNLTWFTSATGQIDQCDLPAGTKSTLLVAPWNHLSSGPARTISVTPSTVATGVPLYLEASAVKQGTQAKYSLTAWWDAAVAPQTPPATLTGYSMSVNCPSSTLGTISIQTPTLPPSTTSWTVSGLPAGATCSTLVTALWSRPLASPSTSVVKTVLPL
ncbi:MAG: fibronectin type III domain-containing protein [Rubrivivax sp.]|nr:MAG: fibronectin type III domain-containing protein [Rubrivivax sp.]